MAEIITETAAGPVWLPRQVVRSRDSHENNGWSLVIERNRIIGRPGWQRVTETYPMPGGGTDG